MLREYHDHFRQEKQRENRAINSRDFRTQGTHFLMILPNPLNVPTCVNALNLKIYDTFFLQNSTTFSTSGNFSEEKIGYVIENYFALVLGPLLDLKDFAEPEIRG